jgi:hypothetical protein
MAAAEVVLRAFLARILGWSNERAVEHALRSIELSKSFHTALVLLGDDDVVALAMVLHRRILGADRPFVVSNPRRADMPATVRAPMNRWSGIAAVQAAMGGSLCLHERRMPRDRQSMAALVRGPDVPVQIIICGHSHDALHPYLLRPGPILIPPLRERASELPRIVDEYAADAISALGASEADFSDTNRRWILDHAARTLTEIEVATLRLVALRQADGVVHQAALRLGMSHVALSHWLQRRRRGGAL